MQGVDYVAINEAQQQLLTYAYSPTQLRKVAVPLSAVKACSGMVLTTDMRDACIYILSRAVIDRIVDSPDLSSIKVCGMSASVGCPSCSAEHCRECWVTVGDVSLWCHVMYTLLCVCACSIPWRLGVPLFAGAWGC